MRPTFAMSCEHRPPLDLELPELADVEVPDKLSPRLARLRGLRRAAGCEISGNFGEERLNILP